MAHQAELEKTKYRNWVKGVLAYKYLKQGIEGFADDVVLQEHKRILQNIKHTPGQTCNQCKDVRNLRPKHASAASGKCLRGNCSCQHTKKKPCPNQVCDAIMGDILDSHGSWSPDWKNADIQKWCSDPWEVAKCFINSAGYADKISASDIDASGLLHVFINNTKLHSHLSCAISTNGTDVFSKVRKRRNQIFHSALMEMDLKDMNDCIADLIAILEDAKELKQKPEAKAAVEKLKQLKQNNFIITTNNEIEVCRDAMQSIVIRSQELNEMIDNAKNDINNKAKEVYAAVDDKTQNALEKALGQVEKQNDSQLQAMKQAVELLAERMKNVETDNSAVKPDICLIQQRLSHIESSMKELETTRNKNIGRIQYFTQKQELQRRLWQYYEKNGYLNTWICPLKTRNNNVGVNKVYVMPNMVIEKKTEGTASRDSLFKTETHRICSKNHTATGNTGHILNAETELKIVDRYQDIFQTENIAHKKIYITGEVGTGKSTLSKMMLYNWCRAIKGDSEVLDSTKTTYTKSKATDHHNIQADNIRDMSKFDFLFIIPLQRMSGYSNIKEMISKLYKDVTRDELLTHIFNQESESCLIIADGLDEWTPPKYAPSPQHVSYGIPVGDGVKNATLVTLSRPSARGILNMKLTEYDQKIKLLGVHKTSVNDFVSKYMELNGKKDKKDERDFMMKIRQTKLEHLEKTPLILQQLVWMYCSQDGIGKSLADIYSNIVNIIFGWFENKEEEDITQPPVNTDRECEQMQLPKLLRRFPRCEQNKKILLSLGKLAFKACIEDDISTFGRSSCGLSKYDIDTLIRCGILVEHNCHDPTIQKSSLSFIHMSYLEFFAAVYISGQYCEQYPTPKKKPTQQNRTVLKELFMGKKSAEDILQLSNILRMVCGLSPFLLEEISKFISKQMMSDESMIRYRNGLYNFSECLVFGGQLGFTVSHIQHLIYACLLQCGPDDKPAVSLSDVIINRKPHKQVLTNIVSESVVSVEISCRNCTIATIVEIMEFVPTFHRLQFIKIDNINSCEAYKHLSSFLSQAVSLKQITLQNIHCDRGDCEGHTIDLPHHYLLKSIEIRECPCLLWYEVNAKSLERVHISGSLDHRTPHAICEHLSSSLSQAVTINRLDLSNITCDRDDCDGHTIGLSKHNQLQSINLDVCSFTLGSMVNTKGLEQVYISGSLDRRTSHAVCEHLSSSLSQAVSITHLVLRYITCNRDDCNGHTIDLSKHDRLQSIVLHVCSFTLGSVTNTKSLQKVDILKRSTCSSLDMMFQHLTSSFIVYLKNLTLGPRCIVNSLETFNFNWSSSDDFVPRLQYFYSGISDIRQYTLEINSFVQTLPQLQKLILFKIDIGENDLTVTAGMKNLEDITLDRVRMSLQTWHSFVDSLLDLQHSVRVETMRLSMQKYAARQYVRQNQALFEVHATNVSRFIFSSKKTTFEN